MIALIINFSSPKWKRLYWSLLRIFIPFNTLNFIVPRQEYHQHQALRSLWLTGGLQLAVSPCSSVDAAGDLKGGRRATTPPASPGRRSWRGSIILPSTWRISTLSPFQLPKSYASNTSKGCFNFISRLTQTLKESSQPIWIWRKLYVSFKTPLDVTWTCTVESCHLG